MPSLLILPSESHPSVTADTLAPVTWVQTGVARRLLHDNIWATLDSTKVGHWNEFNKRQHTSMKREGCWFGYPSIDMLVAMD